MVDDRTRWLTPDELDAWVNLIKLSGRIVALADGELRRRHGITGRDYELLHHLSEAPEGRRVGDLAELIDDSSSGITHRVNRLVAARLVSKRSDRTDQRARCIVLTATGRKLLAEAAPDHVARVRQWIFDALDERDVRHLGRITGRLHEHLRAIAPTT